MCNFNRREFLKVTGAGTMLLALPDVLFADINKTDRPNILWIVSEDNGPFLGCYGDSFATTPNLDKFASQGLLYENAFANAPVCAPARSTLILGMYPPGMGTHHMRSKNKIPQFIKLLPQYLREAGYYCSNNAKQDYNIPRPAGVWDESSRKAHYKKRGAGQPFFSVFNIAVSHESRIHKSRNKLNHKPEQVKLPPYHPDTPEMRHDWAQYYDQVQLMDKRVGEFLDELGKSGLADETIVFYYSDHGGVLPRSKRFLYDSGTHVPLIIRFGRKYQHLAPAKPPAREQRLVSFVDFAPTVLSLAGVKVPEYMQGEPFLGRQQKQERKYVHLYRDRMDERYDMMRGLRDKRFKYIRNYMPHRIYGQYLQYLWRAPATRSWEKAFKEGKCNKTQSIFWGAKPTEELYDTREDPYEVNNLAAEPKYKKVLERMRLASMKWIRQVRDAGFVPEGEMLERINGRTAFELVHDEKFPFERVVETAETAGERNAAKLPFLLERLSDKEDSVRYWAATGCAILGEKAKQASADLEKCLNDSSASVRIAAAEALCIFGKTKKAIAVLKQELKSTNSKVALHAVNVLEVLGEKARPALEEMAKLAEETKDRYIRDAATHIISTLKE